MTPNYFTHSGYIAYFQALFAAHLELQAQGGIFHSVNKTDLKPLTIKAEVGKIQFVLEYFEMRSADPKSENKHQIVDGSFCLFMKVNKGDVSQEEAAKDRTLRISEEIIAKMKEDSLPDSVGPSMFLYSLDENEISHYAVGPEYDNMYGYCTEFKLKVPKRGYEAAKWI